MIADVLAGTRCVAIAQVGAAVPVRALSELELEDIGETARAIVGSSLPGDPDARLVSAAFDRLLLATAVLDPARMREGVRAPLFSASEVGELAPSDVDVLLAAQSEAQTKAFPRLDERGLQALARELSELAGKRSDLRIRARGATAETFFGLASIRHVTFWQALYFGALQR